MRALTAVSKGQLTSVLLFLQETVLLDSGYLMMIAQFETGELLAFLGLGKRLLG